MSAPIPSPSRAYSARVNVPFGTNNTTTAILHQFGVWSLYMHLTNQHTTGTASSVARNANSVWTVRFSCDGTTAGTAGDGVDRWTSTFTPSKLVMAVSGSAHSYMVLRNTFSGYEVLLDLCSATPFTGMLSYARSSVPFNTGSTTLSPRATGTLEEFYAGSRSNPTAGSTITYPFGIDAVTGGTNYSSCLFGPDATFMHILHRGSTGYAHGSTGFFQTTGAQAADTRNWYCCASSQASGRGVPAYSFLSSTSYMGTRLLDGTIPSQGGMKGISFGGNAAPGAYGPDYNANVYYADPMEFREFGTEVWDRGYAQDFYIFSGTSTLGLPGGSYPSVAAQTHLIVGDMLLPFPAGCVLTL